MTKDDVREILRAEREGMLGIAKERKKRNFSKVIVTLVILLNVAFTISILYVFLKVQSEPSALIVAFFSFTTIELWAFIMYPIRWTLTKRGTLFSGQLRKV